MTTTPDVFRALEGALNDLSTALISGRAEDVLGAEAALQSTTARLAAAVRSPVPLDPSRVRTGATAVRIALLRCQSLGASAEILRRVLIPDAAYAANGRHQSRGPVTVESRV